MRFRLLLLCLPVLLSACSKTNAPVRLDFIGTSALTSSNKTVSPNDTLTTRLYALGNDNALKRLRITVRYQPGLQPIRYPLPLSSYDPATAPGELKITYLDSLIAPLPQEPTGREYLFVNQFAARATSGTELWQYTVTDTQESSASRAYLLTVRKADSALVYHSYTALLRPVPPAATAAAKTRARVFLNLPYGLLLPKYAVVNQETSVQSNQDLVDLIALANTTGTELSLSAPTNTEVIPAKSLSWPTNRRRATELRRTNLTPANFAAAVTTADFVTAFAAGIPFVPNSNSTGTLTLNQVVAFKTADGVTGLFQVSALAFGSAPALTCLVRVQKQ